LKASGSSYFAGFKCTAGGQTITAQPAGMVYPAMPIYIIIRIAIKHSLRTVVTDTCIECE
jgi:hypothetical protein